MSDNGIYFAGGLATGCVLFGVLLVAIRRRF
jgi:hypothetical protein